MSNNTDKLPPHERSIRYWIEPDSIDEINDEFEAGNSATVWLCAGSNAVYHAMLHGFVVRSCVADRYPTVFPWHGQSHAKVATGKAWPELQSSFDSWIANEEKLDEQAATGEEEGKQTDE